MDFESLSGKIKWFEKNWTKKNNIGEVFMIY
jgi:hypothetical protein